MSCLLVGEGNFSHAVILSETTTDFVASCFEISNPECEETEANIRLLREKGIEVCVDVDARKLDNLQKFIDQSGRFKRIAFNFPHTGGKMRIEHNRGLMRDFFIACIKVLDLENGRVDVALCRGQGGTPADTCRRYDDTWKIAEMAAYGGFVLTSVEPYESEHRTVGYRSLDKSFNSVGALLHSFSFAGTAPVLSIGRTLDAGPEESPKEQLLCYKREVLYPPVFRLHFSFWVDETAHSVEDIVGQTLRTHFVEIDVNMERLVGTFVRGNSRSWCFELKISCPHYALSRVDAFGTFSRVLSEKLSHELSGFRPRI